jgi:hypothetical protein
MLQTGLMWLKVAENPEFFLFIMWEVSVFFGQLLALQEGMAVGWMTKESSISFWNGQVFCCLQSIQKTSRGAQPLPPIQPILGVNRLGWKANHLSLSSARLKNMWSCVFYTSTPLCSLTVWFLFLI